MLALRSSCGISPATLSYVESMSASEACPAVTELSTCDNVSCKPIVDLPGRTCAYHSPCHVPARFARDDVVPDTCASAAYRASSREACHHQTLTLRQVPRVRVVGDLLLISVSSRSKRSVHPP